MNTYTPEQLIEMIMEARFQLRQERERIKALESTVAKLYARIAELEAKN